MHAKYDYFQIQHCTKVDWWNIVRWKTLGTWCGVKKINSFGFKMSYGLCNCVILHVTVTVWLFKVQFDCVILHDTICIQSWITKSGICCHLGNAKATWTETACGRQSLKLCESLGCSTGPFRCATPLTSTALGKDTQPHNELWSFLPILLIVTNTKGRHPHSSEKNVSGFN